MQQGADILATLTGFFTSHVHIYIYHATRCWCSCNSDFCITLVYIYHATTCWYPYNFDGVFDRTRTLISCNKVLDAYFGPTGIEYSVGRIPMGSCDFSVEQYSFDDVPGDYNLTHFDDGVEKDTVQRVRIE